MSLCLRCPAFADGGTMPARFTADGLDLSPPLIWSQPPSGTDSLALVMEDPDAPGGTWVHWVLWNLPAVKTELSPGIIRARHLADGSRQGRNRFGRIGYGGPAPPPGHVHRYLFRLFALDTHIRAPPAAGWDAVAAAMTGHVLGSAELAGRYGR